MDAARAEALLDFLALADRLKTVERRGLVPLPDGTHRRETSAEHCWNLALLALLLHREVAAEIDLGHALSLIAVHDLVEVEAGDTYAYDPAGRATQAAREEAAADIVFGALPADLGARLRAMWEEFEAGETAEARFAMACDRMQGFLQNVLSEGRAWREHGVTRADTRPRMAPAEAVDPVFAALIKRLYDRAAGGMLPE
ncbi:HD domain-containing protein [Paracraurococcus lichenis]|uniref:HD domain-containing protein n=1 Tax=Paracraurococcus lichenis TaxID=3064888 RepID=A0ABT9E4Z8_9PROT|nr:HD domain-containing protein [Paracraurococcus sp. LOR1-02]MDO9711218.1 HD domain-containing protein [Paracraurococcus sp. LOR1-02]